MKMEKKFEEKININDIDLRNASYVEMSALEAYYDVDRGIVSALFHKKLVTWD